MTATVTTTIECERDDCAATFVDDGWPNDVRVRARKAGWGSSPDLCPAHPPGSEDPGPNLLDLLTGGTA